MIDYITEKVKNTPKHFRFGGINVVQIDTLPSNVDINAVFKAIEGAMPSHYFSKLKGVNIQHHDFFETRDASAVVTILKNFILLTFMKILKLRKNLLVKEIK